MDRKRSFAVLGLRKGAGKDEIRAAYERRLQKYKSSDYEDDPEYVKKKLRELADAYETASRGAADLPSAGRRTAGTKRRRESATASARKRTAPAFRKEYESGERREHKAWVNADALHKAGGIVPNMREEDKKKGIVIVLAILIGVVGFALVLLPDSDSYEESYYYGYEDSNIYGYEFAELSDADQEIHAMAESAGEYLLQQDYADEYPAEKVSLAELRTAADQFVQNYMNIQTVEEVTDYLGENYGDYYIVSEDDLKLQIDEMLNFYGFQPYYMADGMTDPYTGEAITSRKGYLDYLNAFYEETYDVI